MAFITFSVGIILSLLHPLMEDLNSNATSKMFLNIITLPLFTYTTTHKIILSKGNVIYYINKKIRDEGNDFVCASNNN